MKKPAHMTSIDKFYKNGLVHISANVTPDNVIMHGKNFGELLRVRNHSSKDDTRLQLVSQNEMFGDTEVKWHNDCSYEKSDYHGTLLAYVHSDKPTYTEFIDCNAAYDALNDKDKTYLSDVVCHYAPSEDYVHCISERQLKLIRRANVHRNLIMTHPVTKKKSLYLSYESLKSSNKKIDKDELLEHCKKFSFKHYWKPHDMLVWDNRRMMHRRPAFIGRREMLRVSFKYV